MEKKRDIFFNKQIHENLTMSSERCNILKFISAINFHQVIKNILSFHAKILVTYFNRKFYNIDCLPKILTLFRKRSVHYFCELGHTVQCMYFFYMYNMRYHSLP